MLKPIALSHLFKSLHEASAPSPHQFLFLLGSATVFTPRPTGVDLDYQRGETLSYLAQVMVDHLKESPLKALKLEKHDAHAFCSPSVDLLNGPSTIGSEVGDRIAQGLYLALLAVAHGKTTLQIMGHSRGAVEALLLMHEIERIKLALTNTPDAPFNKILLDTPCDYTRAALSRFFAKGSEESREDRALLKKRFDALKLNSFLIDPVPGETDVSLIGSRLSWRDPRIHQKPPGQQHELLLCRDERSTGFYPILPEGLSPLIIPGHHGTPSGNPYTQSLENLPSAFMHYDTFSVQSLVLFKMLSFINQTTSIFKKKSKPIALDHPELDKVTNQYLCSNQKQRGDFLLAYYANVQKNNPAFLQFTQSSYAPIARSYARAPAEDGHRLVRQAEGYISMSSLIHPSPFVNNEHTKILLLKHLPSFNTSAKTPEEMLQEMTRMLEDLTTKEVSPLSKIISSTEGRSIFMHNLSLVIEAICQRYLTTELSDLDYAGLLSVLHHPFDLLNQGIQDKTLSKNHEFFNECLPVLQLGVKHVMDIQIDAIIQYSRGLQEDPCEVDPETLLPKLIQFQELYTSSKTLQKKCLNLHLFLTVDILESKTTEIATQDTEIIRQAGLLLMTNQVELSKAPIGVEERFFQLIKAEAIALGAPPPTVRPPFTNLKKLLQVNTPKETSHLALIQNKLNPMTISYLQHLRREANYLTPTLKSSRIDIPMKRVIFEDPDMCKAYGFIKAKFDAVLSAHRKLMFGKGLPAARVDEFIKTLHENESRLQLHRDPPWMAYFKACLAVIAIIATGIIPGVICLSIYAYRTKKTPLFFAQSCGARFVEEAKYLAQPMAG
ncbi:MAG: hypothetical protein NTW94_01205 [Legionellales bacterium]|nr:hypothetical protein [Legionellales bacterium]